MARKSTNFAEECWILLGHRRGRVWMGRRVRYASGSRASVGFDGAWALAREEKRRDVIGFLHTHPPGMLRPSLRDVRTMRAWSGALGKPMLCAIGCEGKVAAWVFEDDESTGAPVETIELFPRGVVIAIDKRPSLRSRLANRNGRKRRIDPWQENCFTKNSTAALKSSRR